MIGSARLGDGLAVPRVGLGCMGFGGAYGQVDPIEAVRTIAYAIDCGVALLDTADVYGAGVSEEIVGAAIRSKRGRVVLCTKVGIRKDERGRVVGIDGSPGYVRAAVHGCLRRLQVDYVDMLYLHRIDPSRPVEETWGTLSELVRDGLALHLGLSEAGAESVKRANAVHPVAACQSELSMFSRDCEDSLFPVLREFGVGFVAYSPLGRGFLAGNTPSLDALAPNDARRDIPRFSAQNLERNLPTVARLRELAADVGLSLAQLSLAWVLSRGDDVAAVVGTTKAEHLRENVRAAEVELGGDVLAEIDCILETLGVHGARHSPAHMSRYSL